MEKVAIASLADVGYWSDEWRIGVEPCAEISLSK
jgi:hypothetical protein